MNGKKWRDQYSSLPPSFLYFLVTRFIFALGNFNKLLIILRTQELLSLTSTSLSAITWSIVFYTFFNLIRAASEYGIGTLSDYIDRKNLLAVAGFGLFGFTCVLLMIATSTIWWWLIIFGALGISTAALSSLEKSYSAQIVPEHVRGLGYGLLEVTDGIGKLVSSIVVGNIWTTVAASYGFAYSAILSLISMILLLVRR